MRWRCCACSGSRRPGGRRRIRRYPLDDLLGVIVLESVRNRCAVIGEDLGTSPQGFRERLAERLRHLGCRFCSFSNGNGTQRFLARPTPIRRPRSVSYRHLTICRVSPAWLGGDRHRAARAARACSPPRGRCSRPAKNASPRTRGRLLEALRHLGRPGRRHVGRRAGLARRVPVLGPAAPRASSSCRSRTSSADRCLQRTRNARRAPELAAEAPRRGGDDHADGAGSNDLSPSRDLRPRA